MHCFQVRIMSDGLPQCYDVGVFPHPFSCKKFVNCYRNPGTGIVGSIYQCPSYLAFDPVGGPLQLGQRDRVHLGPEQQQPRQAAVIILTVSCSHAARGPNIGSTRPATRDTVKKWIG